MIRSYQDFEIVITQTDDGVILADLGSAPGGRHLAQPIPITLPDDRIAWAELGQGRKSESELTALGQRLFDAIVAGELRDNWSSCMGDLRDSPDVGLRLRLSTQSNTLNEVPLEILCRQAKPTTEFLALDPYTPILRSPRSGRPPNERTINLPLRLLVIIANHKLAGIDVAAERTSLEQALTDLIQDNIIAIQYLGPPGCPNADYATLHNTLTQAEPPYDIIHFIGHGASPELGDEETEGVLLFCDPQNGRRQEVYASDLAGIIAGSGVRIVVLQACEGARNGPANAFQGTAQRLIAGGLPAAIAMQWPVDRDVATLFCSQLYSFWLAHTGLPLERAVTEARLAIRHQFRNRPWVWALPVLLLRLESTSILKIDTLSKKMKQDDPFQEAIKSSTIQINASAYQGAHIHTGSGDIVNVFGPYTPPQSAPDKMLTAYYETIPHPNYRFIGRRVFVDHIIELLATNNRTWLVSIEGMGGIGKTALALEVARICRDEGRFEAIIWTSLKTELLTTTEVHPQRLEWTSLDELLDKIAESFGRYELRRLDHEAKRKAGQELLGRQTTLLVIDNLESLAPTSIEAIIQFLYYSPPSCKTLVTSRHRVEKAERVGNLLGLSESETETLINDEGNRQGVKLGKDETRTLYQKTGGVPLAITWCLGHIRHAKIGNEQILQQWNATDTLFLDYCFKRTIGFLQADNPKCLDVLLAMAVFRAPVKAEAIGMVSGINESTRLKSILEELALMSLIKSQDQYYDVLPPTRAFILAEFDKRPEFASAARKRYAEYFLAKAMGAEVDLEKGGYAVFEESLPHFLDALQWCLEAGEEDMVINFWKALDQFLNISGRWNQALELGHHVVRIAKNRGKPDMAAACLVGTLGWTLYRQNKFQPALKAVMTGKSLYQQLKDQKGIARADYCLGCISQTQAKLSEAEIYFSNAVALFRSFAGEERSVAESLNELGNLAYTQGQWQNARENYEQSLKIFEEIQDINSQAIVSGNLANVLSELKLHTQAMTFYQQALTIFEQIGSKLEWARIRWALGLQAEREGDFKLAQQHIGQAETVFSEIGEVSQTASVRADLDRVTSLAAQERL